MYVSPADRKDTWSRLGEICTTAACWWKCDDMACALRMTTALALLTARRFFLEPHFVSTLEGKNHGREQRRDAVRKNVTPTRIHKPFPCTISSC